MEKTNIRALVLEALILTDIDGEFSHRVIEMALEKYSYLSKADRGFFSKAVHGSIEYRLQLDEIIKKYSNAKRIKPVIREILRMSVYQILYMERVPDRAVINEAVNLVKQRRLFGLESFVNGILRKISREKKAVSFDSLSIKYSMPDFILDILKKNTGKYLDRTLEYFLKSNPISIRVNTSKSGTEDIIKELTEAGIAVGRSEINTDMLYIKGFDRVEDIGCISDGRCYITDVSSSMVSKVIESSGVRLAVDVCAAPGGKSFMLADRLDKSARIISCDISEKKADIIRENAVRQGFTNIIAVTADALVFDERFEGADLVLADLPCSGIGVIGKKPDIKYRIDEENIRLLCELQRNMLNNVCRYVRGAGELVFSTCTLNEMENEENVTCFLKNHPDFSTVDLRKRLDSRLLEVFNEEELKRGYLKLIPGRDNCDGFFIAVFRRNDD